ncbi:hydroxypyruvate isomerase family protein [Variovorax boronicumulans]|uniref:hydroxypyruvate isomerase family protein n=1 Tax=Variovorax boronicumulans TaxID=436515 RepID=UPI001C5818DD
MLRLDPNLRWLYTELPMVDRAAAAAADGFKGVEVAFPYDVAASDYRAELDRSGLALVQILSPMNWEGGERGLAAVPGREDDFMATIETAVDYAVNCGRPLIHAALGNPAAHDVHATCLDTARENLRAAADLAAQHDLTIIIEACCKARLPEFLLHSNAETVALIESIGRDNVKLCFDTFHVAMEKQDLLEELDRVWPHIGHVQIGNAPGRHEPGEGTLDLPNFLEALDRRGWDGWVGLEYVPSRNTSDSLHWARSLGLLPKGIP